MMETYENKIDHINKNSNKICSKFIDKDDPILCNHCLRTSSNGIRCMGICVADNDY